MPKEKISLINPRTEDLDAFYFWEQVDEKQEAAKWNGPYYKVPKRTREEFAKKWMDNEILPGVPGLMVICADEKFIGTVTAFWISKETNWAETGIVIYDPVYWNGGYGTVAYKLWLDFLFETTELHRLGMSTWSGNLRMIKCAEKCGMREEARIRQARIVNGEFYDGIKMGILRSEWEAKKKNAYTNPPVKYNQ